MPTTKTGGLGATGGKACGRRRETMAEMVQAVHHLLRIASQQIREKNHQALRADHRGELVQAGSEIGSAGRLQTSENSKDRGQLGSPALGRQEASNGSIKGD